MKHCPECGAGVRREGAKFCEECGGALAVGTATAGPAAMSQPAPPAPVPTAAPVPAPSAPSDTLTIAMPSRVVLWAAALLLVSAFFPWISGAARIANGMGVPLELLWNRNADVGGFALGWALVILAVLVTVAAVFPILERLRRFLGVLALVVPLLLVAQWIWALDSLNSADSWLSYVGVGAYTAFAAGSLVAFAPGRTR